jgi:putative heme-binding domain-containing protein
MLYEEGGRGIACQRGQKVTLADKPTVTGELPVDEVALDQWNEFRIEARGNVLRHFVNGKQSVEVTDVQEEKRALKGLIGLQVHAGPPMKVEFKDLRWKPMDGAANPAPAKENAAKGKARTGPGADFKLAPGFELEQIYQVPKDQGSWVSITKREDGSFYCADQHGGIYRVFASADGQSPIRVEPAKLELAGAQGLLWHKGTLWVSANEGPTKSGVWKVTDKDGDGEPESAELVRDLRGRGEHGPHSLVASPDGQWIYFMAGNHTDVPGFDKSLVPKVWQEDQLLPRRPDARGHASGRMAPGGWIARFAPDGTKWELFAVGFRNAFDMAFNTAGDLFTFDSDMEWDLGMPWYRPTRICHITPGAEFGWRNGTGKWPDVYEDSMPSQLDIGPGSPTGLVSGQGAKFPEKYQRAVYALDWTFATIYAIHLTPDGDGYRAESEEFLAGKGLPLTDAIIGNDGAMYFLSGGRRSGSALWRITYTGADVPASPVAYQSKALVPMAKAEALEKLGSPNRVSRHQARVALELEGPAALSEVLGQTFINGREPWPMILSSMGLARTGGKELVPAILKALDSLDWNKLDRAQKINWLRAAGLVFARHGAPSSEARATVLAKIDSSFPAGDEKLDRELCRLLCYLNAPGIVGRTLMLMDSAGPGEPPDWMELATRNPGYGRTVQAMLANLPPAQVIHYVYCLRVVPGPWQPGERERYFDWFPKLAGRAGGASYAGFINDLRAQSLATATAEERAAFEKPTGAPAANPLANLPQPKGPGQLWTVDKVVEAAADLKKADRANGKKMFQASLCAVCHRFGGEGGSSGPDLTGVAGRFAARDLAEAIVEPSKVISDQYEFTRINRADGTTLTGRILSEADGQTIIANNPFDPSITMTVPSNSITGKTPSPVSSMPPGLINRLNPQELKDLLAYLLAQDPT